MPAQTASPTATPTAAEPTATPSAPGHEKFATGSTARFEHFRVTVKEIKYPTSSTALLKAEVCVMKIAEDSEVDWAQISWDPWAVSAGSDSADAGYVGNPPKHMYPKSGTYDVGECAAGWMPFQIDGDLSTIRYSNSLGETAVWDATDLSIAPTMSSAAPDSQPTTTETETSEPEKAEPTRRAKPDKSGSSTDKRTSKDPRSGDAGAYDSDYADVIAGRIVEDIADLDEYMGDGIAVQPALKMLAKDYEDLTSLGAPPGVDKANYLARVTTLQSFTEDAADVWYDDQMLASTKYEVVRKETVPLLIQLNKVTSTKHKLPSR